MSGDDLMAFCAMIGGWTALLVGGGFIFRAAWRRFIGPAD